MRIHPSTKFLLVAVALFPLPAFAGTTNPTVTTWQMTVYDTVTSSGLVETSQISALGNTTKVHADGKGRTLEQVDALGNISTATYDNDGNLLSARDANGVGQDCTYDEQNRKTSCTDTAGTTTTVKYSLGGLVLNQQDGKGVWAAADAAYDARGRMTSKTSRLDGSDTTTFTYDANGNKLTITDGEGKTTTYAYDNRNLKTAWTFPGQTSTTVGASGYDTVTYEYDAAARLAAFNRQDGTRDENTYAFNGTLTQKQFKNALGVITDTDSFVYDLNNRLVQAIKGRYGNTVAMAYDAIGRKASESLTLGAGTTATTYTTQYGYDADNRNTSIIYPDGKTIARTYTQRNQLQSVSLDTQAILTSATYDAGGRETQRTLGNGTQQTRTYGNDNLLTGMTTTGDQGSSVGYTYDQNKNVTAEQLQGALANFATTLAQDAKDRLTQYSRTNGDTTNWTLTKEGDWSQEAGSANGTNFTQARTHNDDHQITQITGNLTATPTYDAQGNLATDEQGRAYVWDQEKMLQGVVGGTTNVGYAYDAMGRRVSKTEGGNTTVYVSAGSQEIQEYTNVALAKTYVHGTYVDEVLAQQDNAGSNLYYITDRRYSTAALADQNGNIVERYAYSPYGAVTVLDAGGAAKFTPAMTEILWTGRRLDSTGNYYFRSRYFNTALGRFVSRDIDYLDGANLYEGYFAEREGMDWSGEKWTIKRDGGEKAEAVSDNYNDTFGDLAKEAGLSVDEIDGWLTFVEMGSGGKSYLWKDYISFNPDTAAYVASRPYLFSSKCFKFMVPNVVVAYWGGNMGAFGREFVNWNGKVNGIKKEGYKVDEYRYKQRNKIFHDFQTLLEDGTDQGTVTGALYWGHGYARVNGRSSGLVDAGGTEQMGYASLDLSYRLSIALIYACFSADGKDKIKSPNSLRDAFFDGTAVPVPGGGFTWPF